MWSSDTKTFGKSIIEESFFKKASGRENGQDQEGLFSENLGDQDGVGIWKLGSEEQDGGGEMSYSIMGKCLSQCPEFNNVNLLNIFNLGHLEVLIILIIALI